MTPSRVKQIVKAFNGDVPTDYSKCKGLVTGYELVSITMTPKMDEQNKALALLKLVIRICGTIFYSLSCLHSMITSTACAHQHLTSSCDTTT